MENRYGIPQNVFKNYKSLIDFIYKHQPALEVKITPSSVSKLKNRDTISRAVPRTVENEAFIDYVKSHISSFEVDRFFRELSSESIRVRKSKKE